MRYLITNDNQIFEDADAIYLEVVAGNQQKKYSLDKLTLTIGTDFVDLPEGTHIFNEYKNKINKAVFYSRYRDNSHITLYQYIVKDSVIEENTLIDNSDKSLVHVFIRESEEKNMTANDYVELINTSKQIFIKEIKYFFYNFHGFIINTSVDYESFSRDVQRNIGNSNVITYGDIIFDFRQKLEESTTLKVYHVNDNVPDDTTQWIEYDIKNIQPITKKTYITNQGYVIGKEIEMELKYYSNDSLDILTRVSECNQRQFITDIHIEHGAASFSGVATSLGKKENYRGKDTHSFTINSNILYMEEIRDEDETLAPIENILKNTKFTKIKINT